MENNELQTVTIFRNWVEIAASLRSDAERGKLYQAICDYSLTGQEPALEGTLAAFFTLMRPSIDKSNHRKIAQQKSLQTRLQKKTQKSLQTDVQTDTQPDTQTDMVRARKKEKEKVKKTVPKGTAKEKVSFAIMLPDHLQCSVVCDKWKEWEEYRRKKGKPISEAAARKQMKMLQDCSQEEAIAAMDNSIANDYQGLFPPRKPPVVVLHKKDYSGI